MPKKISPKSLYEYLDSKVVGQEDAKRTIALLGFLHSVRNVHEHGDGKSNAMSFKWANDLEVGKSIRPTHGLVTGPTGCGKTYIVTLLAEYIGLPVIKIDASALVPEGYKGVSFREAMEAALTNILPEYSEAELRRSILLIDEFDKLCHADSEIAPMVQASLLRLLEGESAFIQSEPGSRASKAIPIPFTDMMFIFSGSFASLEKILDNEKPKMGFGSTVGDAEIKGRSLSPADLEKSGMIKEIAGRINIVTSVKELTKEQLLAALTDVSDSVLEEYEELYKVCGSSAKQHITEELLERVAERCFKDKLGARGLKAALFAELQDSLEELSLTVWEEQLVDNPADEHSGVPTLFDSPDKRKDNYSYTYTEVDDLDDDDK